MGFLANTKLPTFVSMLSPAQIQAVLVVYQQKAAESSSWKSLRASAAGGEMRWLVIDNSPTAGGSPAAEAGYEHHPTNPGVSAAYLRGAEMAQQNGCNWLLLLDQDSHFPADWFEQYAASLTEFPNATLLVPAVPAGKKWMSPARYRWHRGWLNDPMPVGRFDLLKYAPINAGMLIRTEDYFRCGGHNPAVSVDFSDFAFVNRLQKQESEVILVNFLLEHSLSGLEKASFEARIRRFKQYSKDAAAFARSGGPAGWLWFWTAWRALLLSIRYRRLQFFNVFWREFPTP
jgi:GT2 family glycosyltransferase